MSKSYVDLTGNLSPRLSCSIVKKKVASVEKAEIIKQGLAKHETYVVEDGELVSSNGMPSQMVSYFNELMLQQAKTREEYHNEW